MDNFNLIILAQQILGLALLLLLFFIVAVTIKKVWRFLDQATAYFENKNNSEE